MERVDEHSLRLVAHERRLRIDQSESEPAHEEPKLSSTASAKPGRERAAPGVVVDIFPSRGADSVIGGLRWQRKG
jgi:hypothetical protein